MPVLGLFGAYAVKIWLVLSRCPVTCRNGEDGDRQRGVGEQTDRAPVLLRTDGKVRSRPHARRDAAPIARTVSPDRGA